MENNEIVRQLSNTYEWILLVLNGEEKEPHIKDMLEGIENAMDKLSTEKIEVDISYYHPNDDESVKVYDVEGMTEEFEHKLNCLIK